MEYPTIAKYEGYNSKRKKSRKDHIDFPIKPKINLSYEEFKKKYHFTRYLNKDQREVVDRYVSKFIKEKNWADIDESMSHILRLQIQIEKYFFALLYQVCEEQLLRSKFGPLSTRIKRNKRAQLLAKTKLIQAIDLLISLAKKTKDRNSGLSTKDAALLVDLLKRVKINQNRPYDKVNLRHGDVKYLNAPYGRDISDPVTRLLVFVLCNIEYRFQYRLDDRKTNDCKFHYNIEMPTEYREYIIPEDYTALAKFFDFWEFIKKKNIRGIADLYESLRQRYKPYSHNTEILFNNPKSDISVLLIPRKLIGRSKK